MDAQDHKMTATSAGHEGYGVYLCHRCGWPFPKPHPSSKHRRAHKKVCGTIEGYKVIHSEEHDHHLADSDDEHGSDENEHTPSPMPAKKSAEVGSISGGVGGKSTKSEDDVFSDAVTEFSDSGISPRLEERFESVKGVDKSVEEKVVESDLYVNASLKVDETADGTEKFDDPTKSDEMSNREAPVNANDQSGSVLPITDSSAEAPPVGLTNGLQPDHKSEILRDVVVNYVNECGDGNKLGEEDKLASITLDSEEGKSSEPALTATQKTEELCDKLVSESVQHDLPTQKETPRDLDGSTEVKSVAHSAEVSGSTGTVGEIVIAEETHESIDASVVVKEVPVSTEDMPPVRPSDATEFSDAVSIDKQVDLVGGDNAGNFDRNENQNVESKDNLYVQTVSTPVSADETLVAKDDQITMSLKKNEDPCGESSNGSKLSEAGNEKGEGATVEEVQVMPDSTITVDNPIDFPRSCDARSLEELSKNKSGSVESRDNGVEKSVERLNTCEVTEVVQSADSELNRDTEDVLDRSSQPTATLEDAVSPVIPEQQNSVNVTNNVVSVDSVDLAGTATELTVNSGVVASERTLEQPISKESIPLGTDLESMSKNSACEGARASESVAAIAVSAEQILESRAPMVQESLPTQKCLNETSPEVEEKHLVEDITTSKSVAIVPSAELTDNDNVITSDKCVEDAQDLRETSPAAEGKNISNIEHVSGVDSKSLQDEVNDQVTKQNDDVSATDPSGSPCSISDSLEGNVGSVSDKLETDSQKHKTTAKEADSKKSDDFEPPSFMSLVQPGGKDDQATAASEIETAQNNQQLESNALKAGWFPSLTNVVNESEGRKKNEEMIAKVTNWSPGKQHGPLKNLLSDVKSPNEKQVPAAAANLKEGTEWKDNSAGATTVSSILGPDAPPAPPNKDVEEWNSPARYPIEIKKEKKKGRSYWVPFVCCSSVHRDL